MRVRFVLYNTPEFKLLEDHEMDAIPRSGESVHLGTRDYPYRVHSVLWNPGGTEYDVRVVVVNR